MPECLPDIQCTRPLIKIPIQQVGVENVEVPFRLESKYGGFHQLNANVSMRTFLDENTKGISMSRLILTLKPYLDLPLKHKLVKLILSDLMKNLNSKSSFMKFEFRMPINKKSIVSGHEFPIYYNCRFEGQLYNINDVQSNDDLQEWPQIEVFRFYQGVKIQYASYCPCSVSLCESAGKGFPHAQRSFAEVLVEVIPPHVVWLEDIIDIVEKSIKTLPYPIVQRLDEQEIARIASENPLFVEDAIRRIAAGLSADENIFDWLVKCTHQELIHTSDAIAICWRGLEDGFDGTYYL